MLRHRHVKNERRRKVTKWDGTLAQILIFRANLFCFRTVFFLTCGAAQKWLSEICKERWNLLYTLKVCSEEVVLHSLNDSQALFSLPAITQCFILEDKSTWRYPRICRHTQPQISNSPLPPAVVREYLEAARGEKSRALNECVSRGLGHREGGGLGKKDETPIGIDSLLACPPRRSSLSLCEFLFWYAELLLPCSGHTLKKTT